jgi:hypothetical protein
MTIAAITCISFLLGFLCLALLIRHSLMHATKCAKHRQIFWDIIERKYSGLFGYGEDVERVFICPKCGYGQTEALKP